MRDPYTVLGVAKTATAAEIKKAYRRIAKSNHPDTHKDDAKALDRFKEANAAYELLSDVEKKGRFDRGEIGPDGNPTSPFGAGGGGFRGGGSPFGQGGGRTETSYEFGGGGPEDLFAELFGGRGGGGSPFGQGSPFGGRAAPPKGADVSYRYTVPFEDAAGLKPQRLTLRNGKTLDVKLPAGFESGRQIRMGGQGDAGPGGAGDALVTLDIGSHRFFRRDGDDVLLDLPITLGEAVTGAKVRVPTVDGPLTLTVPPGTGSGKVFRIPARGFTRADGTRGNQLVRAMIDIPTGNAELEAFAGRWSDERNIRQGLGV